MNTYEERATVSRKHQRLVAREYDLRKQERLAERQTDQRHTRDERADVSNESSNDESADATMNALNASENALIEGLITEGSRGRYRVEGSDGALWCVVRGRLRKELTYAESASARHTARTVKVNQRDPVAIGDRVLARPTGAGEGVIEQVVTRAGAALTREDPDPGQRRLTSVRGIDQIVIVFAAREPAPHLRLADRFLALAESQEATAVLCVNKADQGIAPWLRERLAVYAALGYAVVTTSATTGAGVDELRGLLAGRVSALTGPSGVGKSSLLNTLEPGLALRVSAISESTGKGRHTTTGARMVALSGVAGGWLADTAGIRALALDAGALAELAWLFREFRPLAGGCAFTDCQHLSEPGCAVIAAAHAGVIDAARYDSYRRLLGAQSVGSAWDVAANDWDAETSDWEEPWHVNDE
jgi:ribosome biogenesis GTPase